MDSCQFFLDLMNSLDAAFMAGQSFSARHQDSWGERFFRELSLNHPEWASQKIPIYMKACEILHYFAFFERADDLAPAFSKKPQALLRMVLMLFRHGQSCPLADGIRKQDTADNRKKALRE